MADVDYSIMSPDEYKAAMAQQARAQLAQSNPSTVAMLKALGSDIMGAGGKVADALGVSPSALQTLRDRANGIGPNVPSPNVAAPVNVPMAPQRAVTVPATFAAQPNAQGQPVAQNAAQPIVQAPSSYDRLIAEQAANNSRTMNDLGKFQNDLTDANSERATAMRKEAEENAKTDLFAARANQAYQNDLKEMQAQQAINEENRQHDLQLEMDKYNDIKNQYVNAKVDPDRVWKKGIFGNNMTGNKIFAAIGLAMAGFGGQGGTALQMINGAIDRDIAVQQDEIHKLGDSANMQMNIYGQYKEKFQNERQAELASKMALQEHAINLVNQRKLNSKSQQDINTANKLEAELKGDYLKTQMDFLKVSNGLVTQNIMTQGNLENLKDQDLYRQGQLAAKGNAGAKSTLYVAGAGYAVDEDSAKKARDALQVQNSLNGNIKDLIALREKHNGGYTLDRSDVARGQIIKEQIKRKLQKLYEMGVLQQYEEKSIDKVLPDPDSYSPTGSVDAAYQQLLQSTQSDTTRKLNEYINPALSIGKPQYEGGNNGVQETVVKGPSQ